MQRAFRKQTFMRMNKFCAIVAADDARERNKTVREIGQGCETGSSVVRKTGSQSDLVVSRKWIVNMEMCVDARATCNKDGSTVYVG